MDQDLGRAADPDPRCRRRLPEGVRGRGRAPRAARAPDCRDARDPPALFLRASASPIAARSSSSRTCGSIRRPSQAGAAAALGRRTSTRRPRRRAALLGDGFLPYMITAESFRGCATRSAIRRAGGRELPGDYAFAAYLYFCLDGDGDAARRRADEHLAWRYDEPRFTGDLAGKYAVAGNAEECAEGLARFLDAGATHLVLFPIRRDGEPPLETLEAIAEGVLPLSTGPELGRNGRSPLSAVKRPGGPRLRAQVPGDLVEAREGLPVACPAEGVCRDQVARAGTRDRRPSVQQPVREAGREAVAGADLVDDLLDRVGRHFDRLAVLRRRRRVRRPAPPPRSRPRPAPRRAPRPPSRRRTGDNPRAPRRGTSRRSAARPAGRPRPRGGPATAQGGSSGRTSPGCRVPGPRRPPRAPQPALIQRAPS